MCKTQTKYTINKPEGKLELFDCCAVDGDASATGVIVDCLKWDSFLAEVMAGNWNILPNFGDPWPYSLTFDLYDLTKKCAY